MRKKQQKTEHEDSHDHITPRTSSASASGEKHNKARRYILERINRPILEIYFHLNNNFRK